MKRKKRYVKQTFSLDARLADNLKTAAWYHRTQQTTIVEKALERYFKLFLKLPAIKRPHPRRKTA